MKSTNKPAIRFKGYNDAWEHRKAADIADYLKGNGYSKSDLTKVGTPIILYGRLYTKYQFVIDDVDTFTIPKNSDVYSQGNEVIVPASGETAEDIARASAVEKSGILLGGDLNILRPYDFINPLFLALAISNGQPQKELAKKAQGKSVVHVHNSDIQEVSIFYPSRTEQDKIVNVFRTLDHLITLHQRKLEKLKNIKNSMLEKMFPKNYKDVPEIRFSGFTEAWEQRKFSDIVETRRGLTYKPSDICNDGIRVLRSSNIIEDSFVLSDDDIFVKREAVNIEYASENDILITAANGSSRLVGKHTIISKIAEKSTTHGGFMLLGKTRNPYFINASMGSSWYRHFIELFVAGGNGAIGNLNKNDLDNQEILVPSEKEQNKIGVLFKQFDDLITLHQRKLEKLQNIKKSCLEKMFV